ncbi:MAG: flagellar filament capping protein FliD [Novosphingobium sp.]|jgi:flagellar hook-associated protein 2|nr:flagellar filament capping protein FliD [Novosphingobium sp.]
MATTSTTSATTSATSSLVTALGGGSGVDMTALANSLAVAQFAGRTDQISTKSDKLDKQISAASNLKSMLLSLSTSLGERVRTGDLSPQPKIGNASVASAALSGSTLPKGSYSLEVSALATSQALASPAYAAATSTVGAGTLTLRFGTVAGTSFTEDTAHAAVDITVPTGATLADVASAINAKNAGVTAYVANTTDGAKLVLKGAEGAANGFALEATETVGEEGLANLAWTPAGAANRLLATAGNASVKIDGLSVNATGNTVTDAIPGVTLTLTGTNSGAPTQISFSNPATQITTVMQDLVSALNEVVSELQTATDSKTGDLARDSGALALKRSLGALTTTIIMPSAADGTPRTLADLGLSIQRDGTFSLNTTRLNATMTSAPEAASAMFTNGLYGVFATIDGISRAASTASNPGSLAGSLARYTTQKTKLTEDKATLAAKQETLRQQLVARFAVTDTRVGNSKSTLSFLQNQIDAWNSKSN